MHELLRNSFCINLKSRPDRKRNCESIFKKFNLKAKFLKVDKHENPVQGCFESHLQIIEYMYQRDLDYGVIFEDDIEFTKHFNRENLDKIHNFIMNNNWDLFYFGYYQDLMNHRIEIFDDNTIKVKSIGTHAYIISRQLINKIHNAKFNGTPIDKFYIKSTDRSYALNKQLIIQGGFGSEMGNSNYKDMAKNVWTKLQPYYIDALFINKNFIILAILILIILIIIVLLSDGCEFFFL